MSDLKQWYSSWGLIFGGKGNKWKFGETGKGAALMNEAVCSEFHAF